MKQGRGSVHISGENYKDIVDETKVSVVEKMQY